MKMRTVLLLGALLCLVPHLFAFQFHEEAHAITGRTPAYVRLPLRFEANRGQAAADIKFLSRGPGGIATSNIRITVTTRK